MTSNIWLNWKIRQLVSYKKIFTISGDNRDSIILYFDYFDYLINIFVVYEPVHISDNRLNFVNFETKIGFVKCFLLYRNIYFTSFAMFL